MALCFEENMAEFSSEKKNPKLYTHLLINCGDDDDEDPVSHIANDRNPTLTGLSNKGNVLGYD